VKDTFILTQLTTSVSNQKLLASNVQLLGSDGSFTFEFLWDFAQTDDELYNIKLRRRQTSSASRLATWVSTSGTRQKPPGTRM
jgi:hypothetical protein